MLSLAVLMLAPALTPLILFPALAVTGGIVTVRLTRHGAWIAAALGLLPVADVLIFGHLVLLALGVSTPAAIGVFVLFAAPIVLPSIGGVSLRLTAALLLSVRAKPAIARYPAPSRPHGVADPASRD